MKRKVLARRFDTNDTDDPESSKAYALMDKPLGEITISWQVMRRELDLRPVAVCDDTEGNVGGDELVEEFPVGV